MNCRRLKILSKAEINELYDIPNFTISEQQTYFSLNKKEYKIMITRGSLVSKVHFILQLGYFKAASQFFNVLFSESQTDVDFILQEHFSNAKLRKNNISKQARQSNEGLLIEPHYVRYIPRVKYLWCTILQFFSAADC